MLQSLKQVLLRHRGDVPVYLFYERTKKVLALPVSKYGIRPSEECRARIEEILGKRTFAARSPLGEKVRIAPIDAEFQGGSRVIQLRRSPVGKRGVSLDSIAEIVLLSCKNRTTTI